MIIPRDIDIDREPSPFARNRIPYKVFLKQGEKTVISQQEILANETETLIRQ